MRTEGQYCAHHKSEKNYPHDRGLINSAKQFSDNH